MTPSNSQSGSSRGGDQEVRDLPKEQVIPEHGEISASEIIEASSEEQVLNGLSKPGSTLRFLDGAALTVRFARVFPKASFGFQNCKGTLPLEMSECTESIFDTEERGFMGNFELNSQGYRRGGANVNGIDSLTLNYSRTLREALYRECVNLVNIEFARLATNPAANVLVKSTTPTAADFDGFFKIIMGVPTLKEAVPVPSAQYVEGYKQFLSTANTLANQKVAFTGICVAISMDPEVFLY